jgi:Spy/CpxP family protein refolding chaperone
MKKLLMAAAIVGTFTAVSVVSTVTTSVPAYAEGFAFSFDTGAVRFGYSDGWWDNDHHFHKWRNAREAREFRARFGDRYRAIAHSRARNAGWRDDDHDGVPNALDRHPENPYRQ